MPSHRIESATLIIGMEVHVELATRTKMFSRVPNIAHPDYYDSAPNTLIDPVVMALPGALPVMNREAVRMSVMVGLALGCSISTHSRWDRKNYFYPDLPKGYQISQYDMPLCFDGSLEISLEDGETKDVGIIRAHLEEDAGKLSHELPGGGACDGTLVDFNRAGTPLLEIVSQPDMHSADEAVAYGQALHSMIRFMGVSGGIMQRGQMRFEPNINVRIRTEDGHEVATPIVEIKNLNSFKALRGAIEYERSRQVEAWRDDGLTDGPGMKSTRGWDDDRGVTFIQREKEDAHDYRYFPDPDLVPVELTEAEIESIKASIPELPRQRQARYRAEFGISHVDAETLTASPEICHFYEACIEATQAMDDADDLLMIAGDASAKWILNAGQRLANERDVGVHELGISPKQIAQIIDLRRREAIGSSAADELFELLCDSDGDAMAVAEENGLVQVRDDAALDEWVARAIESESDAAEGFAAGRDAALGRLVGAVMKLSRGQADARVVQEKLRRVLRGD